MAEPGDKRHPSPDMTADSREADLHASPSGRRADGKPYAPGNTRDDGSYVTGKYRPPSETRFRKDNGRPRGRRAKGTKNLATDFAEELAEKISVTENGKRKTYTKQRGVVKTTVARSLKGSDRASETVFRHAAGENNDRDQISLSDHEIIKAWLERQHTRIPVSDDLDERSPEPSNGPR